MRFSILITLAATGFSFVAMVLSLRLLNGAWDPSTAAAVVLCWSLINLSSNLDLGVSTHLTRLVARDGGKKSDLLAAGMVQIGFALAFAIPAYLIMGRSGADPDLANVWKTIALFLPALFLHNLCKAYFEGRQKFGVVAGFNVANSVIVFGLPPILLPLTGELLGTVTMLFIARTALTLVYLAAVLRDPKAASDSKPAFEAFLTFVKAMSFLSIYQVFVVLVPYIDKFYLMHLGSTLSDAYFQQFEFLIRLTILNAILARVLLPFLSKPDFDPNANGSANTLLTIYPMVVALAFGITFLLYPSFAPLLYVENFGPDWAPIGLSIIVGLAFSGIAIVNNSMLIAAHLDKKLIFFVVPVGLTYLAILFLSGTDTIGAAKLWSLRLIAEAGVTALLGYRLIGSPAFKRNMILWLVLTGPALAVMWYL